MAAGIDPSRLETELELGRKESFFQAMGLVPKKEQLRMIQYRKKGRYSH